MTNSEIKTRPDAPGIWERKSDGALFDVAELHGDLRANTIGVTYSWNPVHHLPADSYRLRTLSEEPWPAEPRIEERRMVVDHSGKLRFYALRCVFDLPIKATLDEIRRCEVDENLNVIRVLPSGENA